VIYFGVAAALNGIVLGEEAYLSNKFGAAYKSHLARVLRWL